MNNSTDAQVAAASWTDVLEALAGFSDTKFLESIQKDLVVSAPGHVSSAGSELPIFNAVSDTAFTPAPTTSMGAYTSLTNQTNHTFPVSKPLYDRRHWLILAAAIECPQSLVHGGPTYVLFLVP